MTTIKQSYDVIIVGAGPCGVTAANMLGQSGISTLVIDKEPDIVTIPRAVGMCEGGSRIMDTIDILDDPDMEFRQVNSVHFRNDKQESVFHADLYEPENGHRLLRTFHQPDLEKSLRKSLKAHECVDLVTSTELLEFNDHDSGVSIKVKQGEKTIKINGRYLLACDGASSPIRVKLNIGFTGATYPQQWMILDVEKNPQDSSEVVFSIDPKRPSVTLPGPGSKRRWEFVVKEGDNPDKLFEPENLKKLIGDWGDVDAMEVSRKAVYTFHARTASKYQVGNIFLLGDSAHITPPFAGQGMMAGLRDAQNLCWKIAAVLNKELSPSVLDSYQVERIPQSRQVIKFAQHMGDVILPQNPVVAKIRDGVIKLLGWVGFHSETKGAPLDKIPNHINGAYLKHFFVGKFFKTGFELPQYLVNKDDKKVLADKLLGENFCLLGWDVNPENYLDAKTLARWKSMAGKKATFTAKQNGSEDASLSALVNESQEYKRLFEEGKKVLVVRPDKMMVINCSLKNLNSKLNKYMDKVGCTI
ncbi:MAG: FAD-dependent monooxygenase [Bermanella sp.]